ncbi:hypothetical protein [Brevibacterium sp. ZH18]|uniref:hypothetical protein n=1 Tax=Brevibacterium sp. ZH18 TaxID=2927784 RepID=UPI001F61A310|nr:hypothetical protein [Brevibacterium sp. ZH18]MCI4013009.1 hypothetical protein [Brevibacterium sp. ZH18]
MSALSRGYRMSGTNSASIKNWVVDVSGGIELECPAIIPDWSYFHPISVSLTVRVDHDRLFRTAGIATDSVVALSLSWSTRKVGRSGVGSVVPIISDEATAKVSIPQGHVGGRLVLDARIILLESGTGNEPFAPVEIGSILWEDSCEVQLEGDAPRLPVVMIPIGQPPFSGNPNARWHISINHEDLTLPVDVVVRINLNEANPAIAGLLDGDSSGQSKVLLSSLMLDLHRELVRCALLDVDEFGVVPREVATADTLYPSGSLGSAMEADLALLGGEFETLQNQAKLRWAELDVEIQRNLNVEVLYE